MPPAPSTSVLPAQRGARLEWIDSARAVSIALIVLMHARIVLEGIGVEAGVIARIDDVAGHLRIPLFFAASGLFAAKWAAASWAELFRGRLALLVWVFLVWQPVVLVYKLAEWWLLHDALDERGAWQVGQMLMSVIRPVGELWFLWALVLFFILTKLTAGLPALVRVGVPAAASFVWTAFAEPVLDAETLDALGAGAVGAIKYYVFFVAAAVFSTRIRAFYTATPRWAATLIFLGWLAATIFAIESDVSVPWVRFVLFVGGAAAGFALGRMLEPVAPFRRLGRNTLPVYVAHLPLVVGMTIVAYDLGLAPALEHAPVLTVVTIAAVSVAGAFLLQHVLTATRFGRFMYEPPAWFAALADTRRNA